MAQPRVPTASRVPFRAPQPGPWHLEVADFRSGTSRTASAAAFRFHFRPRPTLPDVYLPWPIGAGTRALPHDYRPTIRRGAIQVVSGEGAEPLADPRCSAPRGFLWGSRAEPLGQRSRWAGREGSRRTEPWERSE